MTDGNRVTLVTGGNRGIGRAIAERVAKEDHIVIVLDKETNEETERVLKRYNEQNRLIECRIDDFQEVKSIATEISATVGPVTCLVNNAGIVRVTKFLEQSPEEWEEMFAVNTLGVLNCCRVFGKQLVDQGGRIVNIASTDAVVGRRGHDTELGVDSVAAYSATKGAVTSFTKALAVEWGEYGVRVNAVAPILVETPRTSHLFEDKSAGADYERRLPLGDTPSADAVADAVAYLLSDDARMITGQIIRVDAGYMAEGEL